MLVPLSTKLWCVVCSELSFLSKDYLRLFWRCEMCTLFFLTACSFNSCPLSYVSDFQWEAFWKSVSQTVAGQCWTFCHGRLTMDSNRLLKHSCAWKAPVQLCLELQFTKGLGLVINEFNFLHSPRLQLPYNLQEAWTLPWVVHPFWKSWCCPRFWRWPESTSELVCG